MADRTVENSSEEVPEIPEMLENVLLFALDEAKEKMEEGAEPFRSRRSSSRRTCSSSRIRAIPPRNATTSRSIRWKAHAAQTRMRSAMTATSRPTMARKTLSSRRAVCRARRTAMRLATFIPSMMRAATPSRKRLPTSVRLRTLWRSSRAGRLRRGRDRREVSDGSRRGPFDGNRRRRRINPPLRLNFCESLVQMHGEPRFRFGRTRIEIREGIGKDSARFTC